MMQKCFTDLESKAVWVLSSDADIPKLYNENYYTKDEPGVGYQNYQQSSLANEQFSVTCNEITTRLPEGSKILEIGCASGLLLDLLTERGMDCTGVELSPWAAEEARNRGHRVYIGTLEEQSFAADFFDAIILLDVIEHLNNPRIMQRCPVRSLHGSLR